MLSVDFAKKHSLSLKPDKGVQPVSVDHTPVRCEGVTDVNVNPRGHKLKKVTRRHNGRVNRTPPLYF